MQYIGMQSVLNGALGKYHAKGFRLVERGNHALILYYRDEWVAVFSRDGVSFDLVHEKCSEWFSKHEPDGRIK